jgi:hypothetical protein
MPINFKRITGLGSVNFKISTGIVATNLVLYLDAGNVSSYPGSGNTWTDISGTGNNATLFNTPTYSSLNNGYLQFNGTNQYGVLSSPSTLPSGNQVTLCVWQYGTTAKASNLFCAEASGNRTINIHAPWSDGNFYWDCGASGASFDRIYISQSSTYTGWHYWVFTKNASTGTMAMYRDNTSIQTGTGLTYTIPTSTAANIGRESMTAVNYYQGYIAQIQIYNRVLNSTELTQNYNADRARYGL